MTLCGISAFAYDFSYDGIYYNITSESKLTVEVTYPSRENDYSGGYVYMCHYSGNISIPENVTYNNKTYTITRIGSYAFATTNSSSLEMYQKRLKSISLPNSIESIGELAFWFCSSLTTVSIPNSVTSIEPNAFIGCNNVVAFFLQSSVPPQVKNTGTFGGNGEIIVPQKEPYLNNKLWSQFGNRIVELISFENNTYIYDGDVHELYWKNNMKSYQMVVSGNITVSVSGNHQAHINVICSRNEVVYANCTFDYSYTISKAPLEFKIENANREYGEDNPPLKYYSIIGFVGNEDTSFIDELPHVVTTATKRSYVGNYPITISGGNAKNYEFIYEPGVLTVTKAMLAAKVNDVTKVYGEQNPKFNIEYYGLKNEEIEPDWISRPTFQTDATKESGVGNYPVKAINAVPVNYDLEEITFGTINVTPAPLVLKANDVVRLYYEEDPSFSYTCSGFVNGDNERALIIKPSLSTSATKTSNVGTYEITVGETSSPNYSISYVNGTLTITPRALMASVGNYERVYNEVNPMFEVKYDGFVGNDDENVLISKPETKTTATKTSDVGTYPIDVIGGSADNYTFNYTSGTLTINKAEQTISWEQDLTGLEVGEQVELKAEASSGLPITYTMDNNNTAEIYSTGNKSYLDCKAGGQFLVRAVQNGNNNYYSSPRASNTVSIVGTNPPSDPTLTIKQADNGSVKIQVSKGSVYTFIMAPNDGWKIHSVTFNNEDVTSQLSSDGSFTTPAITNNSILSVVYEIGSSAVRETKESEVKVQATTDGIRVVNAKMGDVIRVYKLDGLLQHSIKVDRRVIDIPLTKHDVYIVKVCGNTVKLGF